MSRVQARVRVAALSVAIVALRLFGGYPGAIAEVLLTVERNAARKELG